MHQVSAPAASYQLVIFFCDGVLVDSEAIENQLLIDMATSHGLHIDAEEAHQVFVGRKLADCIRHMERATGRALPETFIEDFRVELRTAMRRELKPVTGIRRALEKIQTHKCVASNGPRNKIELALSVTNLWEFFEDRIFSAYDVAAWKPEPDLFLHAAHTMNVAPGACMVIEDSRLGIEAAIAAGMHVVAYAPSGAAINGTTTIQSMDQLPALVL